MRPVRSTAAHKTDQLAELVCSNSLKSESENTAPWLLKEELRRLDSLLLARGSASARCPAVTRSRSIAMFSPAKFRAPSSKIRRIELRREEVTSIPGDAITIVATGPLTSGALADEIGTHHRRRSAVLLRLHQPDRRRRLHRSHHRLPRFALRQVARWHRRLSELSVRSRTIRAIRRRAARRRGGSVAHSRRPGPDSSKPACPSKSWRGAGARRCASVR